MMARTWASAALGGAMGTMVTVYQRHSLFWLLVAEGLLWLAFFLYQRALQQQTEVHIASLDTFAKDIRWIMEREKADMMQQQREAR